MNYKLSIIVPIYGVEQYLRKCVDSLLNQDIDNYEIILVDDGGTDGCPAICDDYVRRLENGDWKLENVQIRVIHRGNGGLSAARNSGLEVAQGEYIMFVDSDDYVERNVLKGLLTQVERDNLDILRYRLQYVNPQYEVYNPYKTDPFKGNDYSEEPTDGITFLNTRMSTACYAWAFIIKRDLIVDSRKSKVDRQDCLFTPGIYFEDTDWTPRMLVRAKRVASTKTVVYNYLQREGSITNAVNRSKQQKVLDDKMRLVKTMQRQSQELQAQGKDNRWFKKMISDTVISIIGILGVQFYQERTTYLAQLQQMRVYPIVSKSLKARVINISPSLFVKLIHYRYK